MQVAEDGAYVDLTVDQFAAGVMFVRAHTLPAEWGTERNGRPSLYVKPMVDDNPETAEWTPDVHADFVVALG